MTAETEEIEIEQGCPGPEGRGRAQGRECAARGRGRHGPGGRGAAELLTGAGVVVFRPPARNQLNCQLATQLFSIKDASETEQLISKLNICGI